MDKKSKVIAIVAFIVIIVLTATLIFLNPFKKIREKKEAQKKVTMEDLMSSASEHDETGLSLIIDEPDNPNEDDEDVTEKEKVILDYPDGYEDLWTTDDDGRQYLIAYGDVLYRDELEEMGIVLNPDDYKEYTGVHSNEDDIYLNKALYPVNIYYSGYSEFGTYFADDVPKILSNSILTLAHEKYIPWLSSQGFAGDLYLVYSHTTLFREDTPDKYGIDESYFYVLDKESFDEWNENEDASILKDKDIIVIIFDEPAGEIRYELRRK